MVTTTTKSKQLTMSITGERRGEKNALLYTCPLINHKAPKCIIEINRILDHSGRSNDSSHFAFYSWCKTRLHRTSRKEVKVIIYSAVDSKFHLYYPRDKTLNELRADKKEKRLQKSKK